MEIQIRYNPYSLCTQVYERDGDVWKECDHRWVENIQGKQLQTWFRADPSKNWRGFADEVYDAANEHVKIFFEGRECDFGDLVELASSAAFDIVPPEHYTLDDETAITKLTEIRDAIANGDFAESDEVQKALANYDNMKSGWFDIAVVATMSSGKSTLINALMRGRFMPTGNMATTAKVVRIFNDESCERFSYKSYNAAGDMLSEGYISSPDVMKYMNESDDVFRIDITGRIPGIKNSGFLGLRLIDTPGPNNSATDEHKEVAFSVIGDTKNQPMILFVQDTTKLEETSEHDLLKEISAVMHESRQAQERFVFVMNRADQIDAKKEDVRDFVEKEKRYLSKNFNIDSPMIIPIAARAALLQSVADSAELTGEEMFEDDEMDLENFRKKLKNTKRDLVGAADLSPSVSVQLASAREAADESSLTMINSGIRGLELTINEYLKKYAMPYKIYHCKRAITNLLRTLRANHNYQKKISEDKAALERSEAMLVEIQSKLDRLKQNSGDFQKMTANVNDKQWKKIVRKCLEKLSELKDDLAGLGREYSTINGDDGRDYIERADVRDIQRKADKMLKSAIEDMKETLLKGLDEQIKHDFAQQYAKCREIINEFKDMFDKIDGLDADDISSFAELLESFDDAEEFRLNSYMKANPIMERTVTVTTWHTRTVDNPKRKGFFGFFKVWQPKTITEEYSRTQSYGDMVAIRDVRDTIAEYVDSVREMSENVISDGVEALYEQKRDDLVERSRMMTDVIQRESDRIKEIVEEVKKKKDDIADSEEKEQRALVIEEWISALDSLGVDAQ